MGVPPVINMVAREMEINIDNSKTIVVQNFNIEALQAVHFQANIAVNQIRVEAIWELGNAEAIVRALNQRQDEERNALQAAAVAYRDQVQAEAQRQITAARTEVQDSMAQRCQQVQDDANNQVRECRRHIESTQGQYVLDLQLTGHQRDDFRQKYEQAESTTAKARSELQQAERDRDTAVNSAKTSSQEAHQALTELRLVQGDGEAYPSEDQCSER